MQFNNERELFDYIHLNIIHGCDEKGDFKFEDREIMYEIVEVMKNCQFGSHSNVFIAILHLAELSKSLKKYYGSGFLNQIIDIVGTLTCTDFQI